MNVATIAGLLPERARLRTHDSWTRDEVLAYQARRLADLRAFAVAAVTADSVRRALLVAGVRDIPVRVDLVDSIPRTVLGKAPLIRRAQHVCAGH